MKRRVKRKLKLGNRFIVIELFVLFVFVGIYLSSVYFVKEEVEEEIEKEEQVLDEEQVYEATMIMVGDNLIHDKIYNEALKNGMGNTYDFKPMLEMIKPIVSRYDIAYYNQETVLGGSEIGVSSYPAFNSPYEVGDAMIDAGFNLVSLATNHTLDRGEKAVLNSRNYWSGQEQVLAVGSYDSFEEKEKERIFTKNQITYTMLNYTYGTNGIMLPNGKEYLVNIWPVTGNFPSEDLEYQNYKSQVKQDVDNLREQVDVLIVAMHWGIEYQDSPNEYQKDMAKYLASLGVDIVIGTHPHVVQPIEWIDDTLVIYSLGNFISAHEVVNMANRVGLMSSVVIRKKVANNGKASIQIVQLENELLYTYYTNTYQNFKVIPFHLMKEEYLLNYKEVYEKYKNIVQEMDDNIYVVPLET